MRSAPYTARVVEAGTHTGGRGLLAVLGPGLLVAATGVGAGDLVTGALAGSALGLAALWAVPIGAVMKFALNEGLARWQLATDTSLLHGWSHRLGRVVIWIFVAYLLAWSFCVGGALMTACGVAGQALLPFDDAETGKQVWGVAHSMLGLILVRRGGYAFFEKAMTLCIGLMFAAVVVTAVQLWPSMDALLAGLAPSAMPAGGLTWIVALVGGVGGTVTLLSYGYWIRERGRRGPGAIQVCRVDLGVAYTLTAIFGVAMVIIGSSVELEGKGPQVATLLAARIDAVLGPALRWVFLAGFWGAVFSSLMGVWEGVPYLFADVVAIRAGRPLDPETVHASRPYVLWQLGLASLPIALLLGLDVAEVQLLYAILGALFMPLLAATLLVMTNQPRWIAAPFRTRGLGNAALVGTLLFFGWVGLEKLAATLG